MIHEGTFDIFWGLKAENHTTLTEGDVVSVPTHCFRGFENISEGYGFLFTVLGGDDTGGVEWAPQVFKAAEKHGLVLLEEHGVWDTKKAHDFPFIGLAFALLSNLLWIYYGHTKSPKAHAPIFMGVLYVCIYGFILSVKSLYE